jgi:hypothetical protein
MSLFIPTLFRYGKIRRIIRKVNENENLIGNLSKLYGVQFKEDWVGRWYAVLNPLVSKMETLDGVPFEYTPDGVSNRAYVEKWCMDHMFAASQFIKNKELLDIMSYSLDRLDENENYLFVLKPILFNDLIKSGKRFFICLLVILVAVVVLLLTGIISL